MTQIKETKKKEAIAIYSALRTDVRDLARTIFGEGFDDVLMYSEDEERLSLAIEAMKTACNIKK